MKEVVTQKAADPATSFIATVRLDCLPSCCMFAQVGQTIYYTLPLMLWPRPITFDSRVVGLVLSGVKPTLYPGHVRAWDRVHTVLAGFKHPDVQHLSNGEFFARFCRAY